MSDITPDAEAARESARTPTGKFGVQEHSAPEAELATPEATPADRLRALADVHSYDSYLADEKATETRMAAFVADARAAIPTAARANFYWDYEDGVSRLSFEGYEDADGNHVEYDDPDEYPDINDFHFDDYKAARQAGFTGDDGTTLEFDDIPLPDPARAAADAAVGEKLQRQDDALAIRHLLGKAMDNGLDPAAVENLTDAQLDRVRRALAAAEDLVRMAVEIRE